MTEKVSKNDKVLSLIYNFMRKIIKKRFQGTHARFISIVTDGQARTERRDAFACASYLKSS